MWCMPSSFIGSPLQHVAVDRMVASVIAGATTCASGVCRSGGGRLWGRGEAVAPVARDDHVLAGPAPWRRAGDRAAVEVVVEVGEPDGASQRSCGSGRVRHAQGVRLEGLPGLA